ncbi:MAG: glycoside hydrolase, partial [Bacteroidales bacterium]|nr:glycoside hydrolase [Bacteroidales bacterium]
KQKNIGITGKGTINGRGFAIGYNVCDNVHKGLFNDPLRNDRPNEVNRPQNIYFRECDGVTVQDIFLRDPGSWNETYDQCTNVLVERIRVDSKSYWNNDGIDIVDCDGVVIRDCDIDAADDVFCFKSHSAEHICQNVLIENCRGRSSANGVKFGTVSKGGFKNFVIRNITIYDTFRSAVTFASVDGGEIDNILVDGIKAYNTGNIIFLRTGLRWNGGRIGSMKNVTIRNVYGEVPAGKPDLGYSYEGPIEDLPRNISPSSIVGIPDVRIQNVTLENIEIVMPGDSNPNYAFRGTTPEELASVPEMVSYYPEFSQFKELPAWGFYIRHADNIKFSNIKLIAQGKEYRPAIVADDVSGLVLENMEYVEPDSEGKSQVVTNNVM